MIHLPIQSGGGPRTEKDTEPFPAELPRIKGFCWQCAHWGQNSECTYDDDQWANEQSRRPVSAVDYCSKWEPKK